MNRRPRRPLTADERRLWAEVARSIAPLPGRMVAIETEVAAEPSAPPKDVPATAFARKPEGTRRPVPIPLAPLERRMVRALARGQTRAEGTLDLHGLTQAEAHGRLIGFLRRAQASGHGLVLVITGRGRDGDEARGVLRRMVPLWLGAPDLRSLVVGFQEAGTRQGGAGALYVRLRRARG